MIDNILSYVRRSVSMSATDSYHHQLMGKAKTEESAPSPVNPDTPKLMAFNGYYAFGNVAGAFLAIDTNMAAGITLPQPYFYLTFIISMDGTTVTRYEFTGTFDGTTLLQ